MSAQKRSLSQGKPRAFDPVLARARRTAMGVLCGARGRLRRLRRDECGQGTTEYAILVGVLVVIAIVAVVAFRGRIQGLWDSIASAVNSL